MPKESSSKRKTLSRDTHLYLTDDYYEVVKKAAMVNGTTVSGYIRTALSEKLKRDGIRVEKYV